MVKYFVQNFLNNLQCLGNKLYVCTLHHKYKAYSKKTGKLKWRKTISNKLLVTSGSVHHG